MDRIAIALPIRTLRDLERLRRAPVKLVELRLDYLENLGDAARAVKAAKDMGFSVIATVRDAGEGGAKPIGDGDRLTALLDAAAAGADYVDVEAYSPIAEKVAEEARRMGVRVVASRHFFDGTPTRDELLAAARRCAEVGDIAKVVATARTPIDNLSLLGLIGSVDKPVIAFAMGPLGLPSRLLAPILGSPWTYASLAEPTAPGQPSVELLAAFMAMITGLPSGADLDALRRLVDMVDAGISGLLRLRLAACREIGRVKRARGLQPYDEDREAQILQRYAEFRELYGLILLMCRSAQIALDKT